MKKNTAMGKLVTANVSDVEVIDIDHEPHLKLVFKGITYHNYTSSKRSCVNQKEVEILLPLWAIPYFMRNQREAVAKFEIKQLDFLNRIKTAYNTEVRPIQE
jgi:hypothetical protein